MWNGRHKSVSLELATAYFCPYDTEVVSVATLPRCYKVTLMTCQTPGLVNYVYCIVARSRLTDVATTAVMEWVMLNSGDTPVAYCTEAVCIAANAATWWHALQLKFVPDVLPEALGRPRCRWEDNINMDLQELGWGDTDWIELAQDKDRWRALLNLEMNHRVP